MINPIWLAFFCGIIIGVIMGGLSMGLFTIKSMERKNRLIDNLIEDKKVLESGYKPKKPPPRKYRN